MRVGLGKNGILLIGKISEPEQRIMQSGKPKVTFGINTESSKNDDGTWNNKWDNVQGFGDIADIAMCYAKGDTVMAIGKWKDRTYNDKEGVERNTVDITLEFLSRLEKPSKVAMNNSFVAAETDALSEIPDDNGDLPF